MAFCRDMPELEFVITGAQFNASDSQAFTVVASVPNATLLVAGNARVARLPLAFRVFSEFTDI